MLVEVQQKVARQAKSTEVGTRILGSTDDIVGHGDRQGGLFFATFAAFCSDRELMLVEVQQKVAKQAKFTEVGKGILGSTDDVIGQADRQVFSLLPSLTFVRIGS